MKAILAAAGALLASQLGPACAAPQPDCCAVIELRQYITYPGKRDTLIHLFDREFIEPQEAAGIRVLGQFRDINDPHHFTWLRGFPSMAARKQSLTEFYYGALWKSFKNEANATLYDNDDVLLLRPAAAGAGFATGSATRAARDATAQQAGFVVATLYHFKQDVSGEFVARFNTELAPVFERNGAQILARFVSEHSPNTFGQLPVRENVNVFVWFARYADRAAYERHLAQLGRDAQWRDLLFAPLYKELARPPEVLMLEPTARSLIH